MRAFDDDYVTVSEAATLLRVAPSTVRRWIRDGDVPGYRVGRRRVALKRDDLSSLIRPARPVGVTSGDLADEKWEPRRLTPEEVQQALELMDRIEQRAKAITARRGGKLFPPSWITINEQRDERSRQLS